MNITLNGKAQPYRSVINITEMLSQQGYDGKIVAVAINGVFVPKSNYISKNINNGDKIEIVAPMQGG